MHKLLQRQLDRLRISTTEPPDPAQWAKLLERMNRVYDDADQERYTLERSVTLSSAEMQSLHARLRAEHDKLKAIFDSAAFGILGIDAEERIVSANPAAVRMLGRGTNELTGRRVDELFEDAMPMSSTGRANDLLERRYERPDGSAAWFHAAGRWVRDRSGILQLGTVVLEDITERKHLECSLRHAQKLESVGRLASGVAHEINTPVQFVNDNVHFLRDAFGSVRELVSQLRTTIGAASPEIAAACDEAAEAADWSYLDEEVPKAVAQTLEGLKRVATIVQSMKAFAHTDHGEQSPADLNAALASALVVAGHEIKSVATVDKDFGELPPVTCCLSDLNQVFLNLIVNSAHAIGDVVGRTGELGRIGIRTRVEADDVVIEIEDSGGGIPDAVAARLFEPFFTTKEVGRGTGQGLALARSIVVTRHRGSIHFESKVNVGTTFVVRLPIAGATARRAA